MLAEHIPGYADAAAHELGLLDSSTSLETLRVRNLVTERAQKLAVDDQFSQRLREPLLTAE